MEKYDLLLIRYKGYFGTQMRELFDNMQAPSFKDLPKWKQRIFKRVLNTSYGFNNKLKKYMNKIKNH